MLRVVCLLLILGSCRSADDGNYLCSKEVCTKQLENKKCASLPFGCSKTDDGFVKSGSYFPSPDACNCCDYCVSWLTEGAGCVVDASGASTPSSMCGPGLACSATTKVCEPIVSACTEEQKAYDKDQDSGTLWVARWRPVCDDEGDYSAVKCVPNSVCYCVEPENGTRIFGETVYRDSTTAQSMTCGCSLAAWRASRMGFDVETAHCMEDGSFDALQCLGGNCTCVNFVDGTPLTSSSVHVSELKPGSLPCFNSSIHTKGRFLRPCEEKKVEWQALIGTTDFTVLNVYAPNCSTDGRYAPAQMAEGVRKCVDPEGNTIEDFEWHGEYSDCQCARTRWLLRENGVLELPVCLADGSFRPWQCWQGICYCVDCNGAQVVPDTPRTAVEDLDCYTATRCSSEYINA